MNTTSSTAKSVFLDALELTNAAERQALIDACCGNNQELRQEVQELLSKHESLNGFLDSPPTAVLHAVDLTSPSFPASERSLGESLGTMIGPYILIEQIGEGGMGLVYMAEQQRPLKRLVALKIIKPGMDSKQVIARFEAERQALALMDHPNIAKVLNAGTTESGRPYFVMELVRGISITEFCDKKRLSVRERLLLFVQVCQAVEHAHQKGIIHRDLKPTNILVTLADTTPVPKVIDFGVAKALGQSLTDHTLYTGFAQLVGTPLYMSPEQAEFNLFGVDTRSDIYSLGVLLYELLTGTTPFDKASLNQGGFEELRRQLREVDPPRPSHRVTTMQQAVLSTVSEKRGIDPRTLKRSIESELDWIVLKALEKDRNRRYASATDFGADVNRFLSHEMVQACPPSWVYFLRKTVRKHRIAFATAAVVLLSLWIGLFATTWQWRRALIAEGKTQAANQLANERAELANHRLEIAENTIEVMFTEFAQEWLGSQSGPSQRQREFLNKAVASFAQLAEEMPTDDKPRPGAIRANLRAAQLLKELLDYDAAMQKLASAQEMALRFCHENPDETDVQLLLVQVRLSIAEIHKNRSEREHSIECADDAMSTLDRLVNRTDSSAEQKAEIAKGFSNCALIFSIEKSRMDEAEHAANEGVRLAGELLTQDPANVMRMRLLANCYSAKGQQALWWGRDDGASEKAYAECIALKKKVIKLAPDRIDVLLSLPSSMQNYGVVLSRLKRTEESHANSLETLALLRSLVLRFPDRPDLPNALGLLLRTLGNNERRAGRSSAAWQYWDQSETVLEDLVRNHPELRRARITLALLLLDIFAEKKKEGKLEQARETLKKCHRYIVTFMEQFPGDTEMDFQYRVTLREMAVMDLLQKNHEEAFNTAQSFFNSELAASDRDMAIDGKVRDLKDHSEIITGYLIPEMIANWCYQIGLEAKVSDDVLFRYRDFQEKCQSHRNSVADKWNVQKADTITDWQELVDRIDRKDRWQTHHRKPAIDHLLDDVLLATHTIVLRDYVRFISKADTLPAHWIDVALLAVSAPAFCEPIEELAEFCERGSAQSDAPAQSRRVLAWLYYRKGQFEKCLSALDKMGLQPSDAFVRAMALKKLGRDDEALQSLELANTFLRENEVVLTENWNAKPIRIQPNIETYRRLKSEAELLVLPAP